MDGENGMKVVIAVEEHRVEVTVVLVHRLNHRLQHLVLEMDVFQAVAEVRHVMRTLELVLMG